jgi:DNA-binding protein YbaB
VASAPEIDIHGLLQQAQRMRRQLAAKQSELLATDCRGSAGGGLVKAIVSGRGELTGLEISQIVASSDRVAELADMIVSAVQDAHANLRNRFEGDLNPIIDALGSRE